MKNIITVAFLALVLTAQAQSDSSQLAVFNTGRNITVLSADFGAALTQDLIGEMVRAFDTVMVESLRNGVGFGNQGFTVSPNPTRNQTNVVYQFLKETDVTIEVKASSGQVIFSRILRGATSGSLDIQTVDWASGTYFVMLQYGKEVKTKQLVVRH